MSVRISRKKFDKLQACATEDGVIAAAAMDQRGSLQKALAKAGGREVGVKEMREFKAAVTEVLTPHASAILLDPPYGLKAAERRAQGAGLLLAYEKSGYDTDTPGRLPDLLDTWSVRRLEEAGADGVKVLLYYNPFEGDAINNPKHAFVERVGAECEAVGLPFFLEPVTYDDTVPDPFEFAKRKPEYVRATVREFTKDRYLVDILKLEVPVDAKYTGGLSTNPSQVAYDKEAAKDHIWAAADEATKPFIYLSAGVDMDVFVESLELAGEAGVRFAGVLCGRATWKEGIPIYAQEGVDALRGWLQREGVENITKLNGVLDRYAQPWWDAYGGRESLEVY